MDTGKHMPRVRQMGAWASGMYAYKTHCDHDAEWAGECERWLGDEGVCWSSEWSCSRSARELARDLGKARPWSMFSARVGIGPAAGW